MNIKSILVRLQGAMGCNNLAEQMVLLPKPAMSSNLCDRTSTDSVNFLVGFNGSPKSLVALDMALWMAHQTRLATRQQVMVQVVYVIESENSYSDTFHSNFNRCETLHYPNHELAEARSSLRQETSVLTQDRMELPGIQTKFLQYQLYEQADKILWQARCLADEWQSLFKAYLRFGNVATELEQVIALEGATLLLLGCNSVDHPIVQQLGKKLPCAVLGIPCLNSEISVT